jgi:hypothetical protein
LKKCQQLNTTRLELGRHIYSLIYWR